MKTTAVYLLLAAISMVAAIVLSWPRDSYEVKSKVGEDLFEVFADEDVSSIELVDYDPESRATRQLTFNKKGGVWKIRERNDYLAGNTPRIDRLIAELKGREIHDAPSDQQSDWEKFGVVDPVNENAESRDSYGARVEFKDYRGQSIASLIVGGPVKGSNSQQFVRIPGQPWIYVIDFEKNLISTNYSDWVDHNLMKLKLSRRPSGDAGTAVEFHNYRLSPNANGESADQTDLTEKLIHRTAFKYEAGKWTTLSVEKPNAEGNAKTVATDNKYRIDPMLMFNLTNYIGLLDFSDVGKLSDSIAEALNRNSISDDDLKVLAAMKPNGILVSRKDDQFEIRATNGHVVVKTDKGVVFTIAMGNVSNNRGSANNLQHWLKVFCQIDNSAFPEIPPLKENATEDEKAKHKVDSDIRATRLKEAQQKVESANKRLGPWIYLIDESKMQVLQPELEQLFPRLKTNPDAGNQG